MRWTSHPASASLIGESADYFHLGGGVTIGAAYRLALDLPLFVGADLGYTYHPLNYPLPKNLQVVSAGVGVGAELEFLRRLPVLLYARGGYYYGFSQGDEGSALSGVTPTWLR